MTEHIFSSLMAVVGIGLGAGVALGAISVLLNRMLYGGRALQPPVCSSCGSLVRGNDDALPAACPECGRPTSAPGALRWVRQPRRTRARIVGATILRIIVLPPLTLLILDVVAEVRHPATAPTSVSAPPPMPTVEQIVTAITRAPGEYKSWAVVEPALESHRRSLPQLDSNIAREALSTLVASGLRTYDGRPINEHWLVPLAECAVRDDEAFAQTVRGALQAVLPQAHCVMTPCVQPGGEVTIGLLHQSRSSQSFMDVLGVRVQGSDQQLIRLQPPRDPVSGSLFEMCSFTAPSAPGEYEIEIDWWADYVVRPGKPDPNVLGLAPQRETSKRTLRVSNGQELVPFAEGPSADELLALVEQPYIVALDHGERAAVWLRFANVPARLAGTFLIETNGRWEPLIERAEVMKPLDVVCVSFATTPAGGWPERLRVRFEPTNAPVVATPSPSAAKRSSGVTPSRALDRAWSHPFTCDFVGFANHQTRIFYKLDSFDVEGMSTPTQRDD